MTTQTLQDVQYRLARHYLNKLRQAESATRRGRESPVYWLNRVQQDWAQIRQWQSWSCSWAGEETERARLCIAFPLAMSTVMRSRQTQTEFLDWARQALEAARHLEDREAESTLLYRVCFVHLNRESLDDAIGYARQLAEYAQAAADGRALGRAWSVLGAADMLRGAFDSAMVYLSQSLEQLQQSPDDEAVPVVWRSLGHLAAFRGDFEQAYSYYLHFLNLVTARDRPGWISTAHVAISALLIELRDYPAAEDHARLAVAICRRNGFARGLQTALISLAHAEKCRGRLESACGHFEQALAGEAFLPPSAVIDGLHGLGQACFRLGDQARAGAHFAAARALARQGQVLFRLCDVLPDMVVHHLSQQQFDEARACLQELVTAAMQLGTAPFLARAVGAAVLVWQQAGQQAQAAAWAELLPHYARYLDPAVFSVALSDPSEAEAIPVSLLRDTIKTIQERLATPDMPGAAGEAGSS